MSTIARSFAQVKDELPELIEGHVAKWLAEANWKGRRRHFSPVTLLLCFVTQVMHGNTAIENLRHLCSMTCTATAYCKARMRLPLSLIEYVCASITGDYASLCDDVLRWRGHRVWFADGSSFSMPDKPSLQAYFGQPGGQKPGCGFPMATWMVLCNSAGFVLKSLVLPHRVHDASQIRKLHKQMAAGDVMVYDRAGCSYAHLALIFMAGLHGIFRVHQRQNVDFTPGRKHARGHRRRKGQPGSEWIASHGECDQWVRWFKPETRPDWMTEEEYQALPDSLELREVRYTVHRKGVRTRKVTLVTTLLAPDTYPIEELADQYRDRWKIETNFRHLKQTMKMDVLKCWTVDGVRKEVAIFVLVYNLVRYVMLRASQRQSVPLTQISFKDALRWLRHGDGMIDLVVNPRRPDRFEPRVVKRRPKQYSLMRKPRWQLRQNLMKAALVA